MTSICRQQSNDIEDKTTFQSSACLAEAMAAKLLIFVLVLILNFRVILSSFVERWEETRARNDGWNSFINDVIVRQGLQNCFLQLYFDSSLGGTTEDVARSLKNVTLG